jgi:hypothetical protein
MKRKSFAKTRDANEPEIMKALKSVGATIIKLDRVDLLVGYSGTNFLLEVKNPLGRNKIEDSQQWLLDNWKGQYKIVRSVEEALTAIGAIINEDVCN